MRLGFRAKGPCRSRLSWDTSLPGDRRGTRVCPRPYVRADPGGNVSIVFTPGTEGGEMIYEQMSEVGVIRLKRGSIIADAEVSATSLRDTRTCEKMKESSTSTNEVA